MARPRQISDEQILEVARDAFLAQGAGLPTANIAERLNISQSLLFQRFGTKENLLLTALAPNQRPSWLDKVSKGPDDRPVAAQLLDIAEELTRYFQKILPALAVLRQAGVDLETIFKNSDAAPPQQIHRELVGWFQRAQERGLVRQSDAAGIALSFQGALLIQPYMSHITKNLDDERPAEPYLPSVVQMIWRGIAPYSESGRGGSR